MIEWVGRLPARLFCRRCALPRRLGSKWEGLFLLPLLPIPLFPIPFLLLLLEQRESPRFRSNMLGR